MTDTFVSLGHFTENASDLNFVVDIFEYTALSIIMGEKQACSD
jgi:hypothetical protein